MPLSPEQRALRASIAAHVMWSREPDPSTRTAPGRRAFLERFEREADPDGTLDPAERARRAEHLRKAYFARLALKSSKAPCRPQAGGRWRLMPTIVKLPSGRYQIKPNDSDRKKGVSKETFPTEADAKTRLAEIRRQLAAGTVRPDDSNDHRRPGGTATPGGQDRHRRDPAEHATRYDTFIRVHIAGTPLGDRPMCKVTYQDDIVPWLESRRKGLGDKNRHHRHNPEGLADSSMNGNLAMLRGIFLSWIDAGKPVAPGGNPVRKRLVKSQPKDVPLLTDEQMDRWRDHLIPELRAMFDMERWYGSRTGEVRGLREEDISWSGPRDPGCAAGPRAGPPRRPASRQVRGAGRDPAVRTAAR